MAINFDVLSGTLKLDTGPWKQALGQAAGPMQSFIGNMKASFDVLGRGFDNVSKAVAAMGAAIAGLSVAGMKFGASYEQAMARVKAITQATDSDFKSLGDEAKRLGVVTVYSAKEAAEGMSHLAEGGLKTKQIISAMPQVLSLAAVGQIDVANASQILIHVMEGMNIKMEQLPHTVDVLAKAFTMGGNDMQGFAEAMKFVAPVAHAAGQSLESVAAEIQILGKAGIDASMGGTALRGMFSYLSIEGPKVKKDFSDIGVQIYNAAGKLRPLADIIDDFNKRSKVLGTENENVKKIMQDIGQRAGPAMLTLLNKGGTAIRAATKELVNSAGTAEKVAEIQQNTFGNRLKMVVSTIQGFGITLNEVAGGPLKNMLVGFNNWMTRMHPVIDGTIARGWTMLSMNIGSVARATGRLWESAKGPLSELGNAIERVRGIASKWFGSLPQWAKDTLKVSAALLAVSKASGGLGGMIPIVGGLLSVFSRLTNPIGLVVGAFKFLGPIVAGLASLFGPVGIVIAGVGAAIGGVGYLIYARWAAIQPRLIALWEGIKTAAGTLGKAWEVIKETAVTLSQAVADAWRAAMTRVKQWFDQHSDQIMRIKQKFLDLGDKISAAIGKAWESVKEFADGIAQKLVPEAENAEQVINAMFVVALELLAATLTKVADIVEALADALNGDFRRAFMQLKDPIVFALGLLKQYIDGVVTLLEKIPKIGPALAAPFRAASEGIQSEIDNIEMAANVVKASIDATEEAETEQARKRKERREEDAANAEKVAAGHAFKKQREGELSKGARSLADSAAAGTSDFKPSGPTAEQQEMERQSQELEHAAAVKEAASLEKKAAASERSHKALTSRARQLRNQGRYGEAAEMEKRAAAQGDIAAGHRTTANNAKAKVISDRAEMDKRAAEKAKLGGAASVDKDAVSEKERVKVEEDKTLGVVGQQAGAQGTATGTSDKAVSARQAKKDEIAAARQAEKKAKQAAWAAKTEAYKNREANASDKAAKAMAGAADNADKLAAAEKEAADNALHAQGQLTPEEQQTQAMMHQGMQQAMQQAGQQMQQMGQQAMQVLAQGFGGGQLQDMIDAAKAKGDPVAALDLLIGNVQQKVQQANYNLHTVSDSLGDSGSAFPGADNSAYQASINSSGYQAVQQFTDLLNSLQKQRANLVAQMAKKPMPHMAEGGITVGPMTALIGEDGPEAVIPLQKLWQQLQSTMAQGLGGTLGSFTSNFQYWTQQIGQRMNAGLPANLNWLNNLAQTNETMTGLINQYQQHSQINLQPVAGSHIFGGTNIMGSPRPGIGMAPWSGPRGNTDSGGAAPVINLTVHGVDMANSQAASKLASQLVPHIDSAMRRMGTDTSQRSALRAASSVPNVRPTGYAK